MSEKTYQILTDLQSDDASRRIQALKEIGLVLLGVEKPDSNIESALSTKKNVLFEIITQLIDDPNMDVRRLAASDLGSLEDARAIPYLIGVVNRAEREDEKVRASALRALRDYRDPAIAECLTAEAYRNKHSRRPRQEVAEQLRYYNTEEAVDALLYLLNSDEDVYVLEDAAESLLALNRPRLLFAWEKLLEAGIPVVVKSALTAIRDINRMENEQA